MQLKKYLDAITLTNNVVSDWATHAQAVENPVAGVEVVSGRSHRASGAEARVADLPIGGEEKGTVPLAHS